MPGRDGPGGDAGEQFHAGGPSDFQFAAEDLSGPQSVKVSAEDWNAHVSVVYVTLLDAGSDIP